MRESSWKDGVGMLTLQLPLTGHNVHVEALAAVLYDPASHWTHAAGDAAPAVGL